jgi:hypothetical protein
MLLFYILQNITAAKKFQELLQNITEDVPRAIVGYRCGLNEFSRLLGYYTA